MTTNQQIDLFIRVLYEYQVTQQTDLTNLPVYHDLCRQLFAEVPGMNEEHLRNLLYIMVSKKLIQIHTDNLAEAYNQSISLSPGTIGWYKQFQSYFDYLDYLQEKHQPKITPHNYEPDADEKSPGRFKVSARARLIMLIAAILAVLIVLIRALNT